MMPRPMAAFCGRVTALAVCLLMAPLYGQSGVVIFTGSANGVYQNCLCPDKPLGGLERRAQFIADLRVKSPDAIVLDAGDNFVEFLSASIESIMLQGFELINYDLITLGDQDIAFAPEEYAQVRGMVDTLGSAIEVEKGELTYSILPLLHPRTSRFYPEGLFDAYELNGWAASVEQWLQMPTGRKTVRILLSHAGFETDKKIAERFGDIDIIIGGHSQTVVEKPAKVNGVIVVQAGGNAGYVGEINLKVRRGSVRITGYELHPMTLSLPGHPEILKMIDQLITAH
ncbi:MAG: hypothetical protein IID15_01875 [Candidatus Marinimicrobia bacterium]|nr:hypothetical protein [Candidatus Neomarinimicrobiota bacterium]